MTALANERMSSTERWTRKQFPLAVGNKAWKNGIACADLSSGKVEPGHGEADLLVIGRFAETIDATAAEKLVNVDLGMEIEVVWYENATAGDAVVAADLFNLCYVLDDQTVTRTPGGRPVAGRIWAVDSARGVAVEKLQSAPGSTGGVETALPAFAANNIAVPDAPANGAVYDVPATGAASTITLPAIANEGTTVQFFADGTKNAHTVQYRDATGPVNLTTALTAAKRHLVIATYLNGIWAANAYVAP